jgi:hypothetical protein
MGTSLTGLTPSTTYDALIKVGDNGPLSGTLKTLSDGLGNDSALALSTGGATITGTLSTSSILRGERVQVGTAATLNDPTGVGNTLQFANYSPSVFVTGSADSYIYKNSGAFSGLSAQSLIFQTRSDTTGGGFAFVAGGTPAPIVTMTGSGNVGIGTTAPLAKLQTTTAGTAANEVGLRLNNPNGNVAPTGVDIVLQSGYTTGVDGAAIIRGGRNTAGTDSYITFQTNSGSGLAEVGRWLPTGGLTFNGDTSAANALDDYEEGTWTMGISFGGGSTGITYSVNTGTYTKIGRQVTVNGYVELTSKGSSTGTAAITGLPFTIANSGSNYSAPSLWFNNITFLNQFQGFGAVNTTTVALRQITSLGALTSLDDTNFANNSEIIIGFTYFV